MIVAAAINDLDPDTQQQLSLLQASIKDVNLQHRECLDKLAEHDSLCRKQLEKVADDMKTFVFETQLEREQNHVSSDEPHETTVIPLNLEDTLKKIRSDRLVFTEEIVTLTIEVKRLSLVMQPTKDLVRGEAIKKIAQDWSALVCPICFEIGFPVTMKFPCYQDVNHVSGRPNCSAMICLRCARDVTGLTKDRHEDHVTRCVVCRSVYPRVHSADRAYLPNMLAVRMFDTHMKSENTAFQTAFGESLKVVKCSLCEKTFSGLSNMHTHMRDECPKSMIPCRQCRKTVERSTLDENRCCSNGCPEALRRPPQW